jgi:hypothetical protein
MFGATVEERERLSRALLSDTDREWRRQSLKTIGNAGAYGILVRFDQHRRARPEHVDLHTPDGHLDWEGLTPEQPGPWCAPFLPACITGAARLLLAAFERLVTDAGGTVAYRDTDSMFVVAAERPVLVACPGGAERLPDGRAAVRALAGCDVAAIAERFDALGIAGPLWKLEHADTPDLSFLGVRSKSYVLYQWGPAGPEIIKASDHGLGFLLDPTRSTHQPQLHDSDDSAFAHHAWTLILNRHHEIPTPEPTWASALAVMRLPMGTPIALRGFNAWNADLPVEARVRPHGFALSAIVAPLGEPKGDDPEHFRPVAPYEADPARWLDLEYCNLHQPDVGPFRAVTRLADHTPDTFLARTIGQVLRDHATQPESKLAAPDGTPCEPRTRGLLQRRAVDIDPDHVVYLGKEAGELLRYPSNVAADLDDRHTIYTADHGLGAVELDALRDIGASALASRVDVDRSTIHRILTGETTHPRSELVHALRREATLHARRSRRSIL